MPWSSVTSPAAIEVITMQVIADELCMTAVARQPINTSGSGESNTVKKVRAASDCANPFIAPLMTDRPANIIPNPAIAPPACFLLSLRQNADIAAPTKVREAKTVIAEIPPPPNEPSATKKPVTVVPIFAPYTIPAACVSVIAPASTAPITATVTALELCSTAVTAAPMPTFTILRSDAAESNENALLPPSERKLSHSMEHATINIPMPDINSAIAATAVSAFMRPPSRRTCPIRCNIVFGMRSYKTDIAY